MSISKPQNTRSRRTREALQSSALEILRDEGPHAVTMSSVAKLAGCSRRAVYLHFESRAQLLVSLIDYANRTEGFDDDIQIVRQAEGPAERLRAHGQFLGRYHTKIAPIVIAVARVRDTDEAAAQMWETAMKGWRSSCRSILEEVAGAGLLNPRFDSLDDAVDLLWSLMSIDILRALVHDRGWSGEKYGRYLSDSFVALFLSDSP